MAEGGLPPPPNTYAGITNNSVSIDNNTSFAKVSNKQPLSSFKGEPALFLTPEEEDILALDFQWTLIGKFFWGRPAMNQIRKEIVAAGFRGECKVGLFDQRHVLFKFDREEDFQRFWTRKVWNFQGFQARIFKWSKEFDPTIEPSISPVWISFPHLPLHLFNKEKLYSLASVAGQPLKLDSATAAASDLVRPSEARVCVEMDLTKTIPNRIWVGSKEKGKWQPLVVEEKTAYCSKCCKLGHESKNCDPQRRPKPKTLAENLEKSKNLHTGKQVPKEWTVVSKKATSNQGELDEASRIQKGKEVDPSSLPISCPLPDIPEPS